MCGGAKGSWGQCAHSGQGTLGRAGAVLWTGVVFGSRGRLTGAPSGPSQSAVGVEVGDLRQPALGLRNHLSRVRRPPRVHQNPVVPRPAVWAHGLVLPVPIRAEDRVREVVLRVCKQAASAAESLPKRARTALRTEGRVAIVVRPFSDGRPFSPANDVHAIFEHVHVRERRVSELLRLLVERIDRERPGCIRHIVGEPWQPLPCEGIPSVEPAICRGQCVANQQDTAQVASESARSSRSHPEPRRQREARTCP